MTATTCELIWLCFILRDLSLTHTQPALLFCDNKAALHIVENPVYNERIKYMEIDCHVVRQHL